MQQVNPIKSQELFTYNLNKRNCWRYKIISVCYILDGNKFYYSAYMSNVPWKKITVFQY